jgi:hypothetical protein
MAIKSEKKPTEKEYIIDVPMALRLSAEGASWPLRTIAVRTDCSAFKLWTIVEFWIYIVFSAWYSKDIITILNNLLVVHLFFLNCSPVDVKSIFHYF